MPGPFPGMDPYLESPLLWSGVHNRLIVTMASALNAGLPASYVAVTEEWLYVLPSKRRIQPDVSLAEIRLSGIGMAEESGVAVASPIAQDEDEPRIIEMLDRCYDEGAFARLIDYSRPPTPHLKGEDAVWADTLLRQHGLRSS